MAASGFEGFEKRLELQFSGDDPATVKGLRRLDFPSLEKVLHAVQCTVVSGVGNKHLDSYVLSESSLFVYPTKIIIKTCGTTQLLKSVRPLVDHAIALGLTLCGCTYTRGSFIFPRAQPYPHTSFKDEVLYLEESLPKSLSRRKKAKLMPSKSSPYKWHVFTAGRDHHDLYTVEICMTDLDRVQAKKFFRRFGDGKTGDSAGEEMTGLTGIADVNPNALICDYAFDPCGYSMNGIDGDRYSTVHVTPEDGFSYASFECVGSVYDDREEFFEVLRRVVGVFRPAAMSVSTSCAAGHEVWRGVAKALEPLGMRLRSRAADEFPEAGNVVFQTFAACRKKGAGCVVA
ncbi:S-adenosylmethionine decarboxylase proenzyme 4 [Phtheirospermum japonicum]|uniref:S-adenosylmethionine decarboxylase proenzyme n=1 Tax=Phtheirospermum japonicum TaxID=374723 RepID=A0A830CHX8_9LAMI|nr:S-adenosylmethionine decarboxylase proenzyme 4 [Phtheirospermum japonicum]